MLVVALGLGFWALGWVMGVPVARRMAVLAGLWAAALLAHLVLPEGNGLRAAIGGDARVWAVLGGIGALVAGYGLGLRDADALQRHGEDRATAGQAAPLAVVLPRGTGEVRELVAFARAHRLPLVPSGGRTGLCGGALAAQGELVVAMDRMDRVLEFDPVGRTVRVEAGMVTARLQAFAAEQGLFYPVDFASAGSSQIGGNVATNAGGVRVIRHGMTRAQVAGLRVVDGRAEVMELNRGLVKNNTGPDLRHLFIGSEGTLGIITEVTLQLCAPPGPSQLMLFSLPGFIAVLDLLRQFSVSFEISAFEFFSHNALQKVLARTGGAQPLREGPFYAMVEFDRHGVAVDIVRCRRGQKDHRPHQIARKPPAPRRHGPSGCGSESRAAEAPCPPCPIAHAH